MDVCTGTTVYTIIIIIYAWYDGFSYFRIGKIIFRFPILFLKHNNSMWIKCVFPALISVS